ncbi:MAG: recombinase family protein [Thermoleophilia bacterium]
MRAYAYVRVSKLGEASISPEIQRDELARFADQKGWTITGWYEDLDLSGRAWDRKRREGLNRLLDDALAGGCDVVLFYKIDRLAREEEDFHAILAALRRAGIHCDSPGNPNDGSPESALSWRSDVRARTRSSSTSFASVSAVSRCCRRWKMTA